MAKPNAVVSRTIRLARGEGLREGRMVPAEGLGVEFDDGRRVRLDPENPRSEGYARVLAGLAELRHPVYLELDPATETISRLLVPNVGRVIDVRPSEDGLEIELDTSHARHLLRRQRDDFAEMETTLRDAKERGVPVILTSDDAQEVEDARFFKPAPDGGPIPDFPPIPKHEPRLPPRPRWWPIWPWPLWPWGCVSMQRAQQIFDAMGATTCNPVAIAPPCIPFMYPDNGCWGRAHEMRRLMNIMAIYPRKIWIRGSLRTPTRNNPLCFVRWSWHVAPTICVRRPSRWWYIFRWWASERMVIDPSLFTTPVTKAQWKAVQGDPAATLNETDGSIFHWYMNETDPTYSKTNQVLATYRVALQNRVNQDGPPPYANCP